MRSRSFVVLDYCKITKKKLAALWVRRLVFRLEFLNVICFHFVQLSIVNVKLSSFHISLTVRLFFFWTDGMAMRAALDYHSPSGNFLFFKNLTTFGSLVYIHLSIYFSYFYPVHLLFPYVFL